MATLIRENHSSFKKNRLMYFDYVSTQCSPLLSATLIMFQRLLPFLLIFQGIFSMCFHTQVNKLFRDINLLGLCLSFLSFAIDPYDSIVNG